MFTHANATEQMLCAVSTIASQHHFRDTPSAYGVSAQRAKFRQRAPARSRTGRDFFIVDPLKFKKAVEGGEASGRPVKVLWHSHPDVGAYFSETDAAMATMGGDSPTYDLFYLVTSVKKDGVDDHKLFAWDPESKGFVETGYVIVD